MAFASIHIPEFMVQAVVRTRLHLRNRAIVLVDGVPPLVKVVAANVAALEAGIQPGMSKAQAAQFTGIEILNRSRAREKLLMRRCSIWDGRFRRASRIMRRKKSSWNLPDWKRFSARTKKLPVNCSAAHPLWA